MKSLSHILDSLLAPVYAKNPHVALMKNWSLIVGTEIASYTWPCKILQIPGQDPLLYVAVKPRQELQAWAQSMHIIERVNAYLGYRAIARIRLTKAPMVNLLPE
jgi:hypothetical protein